MKCEVLWWKGGKVGLKISLHDHTNNHDDQDHDRHDNDHHHHLGSDPFHLSIAHNSRDSDGVLSDAALGLVF